MQGIAHFNSPVGWLRLKSDEDVLTALEFVDAAGEDDATTPVIQLALQELTEYFTGARKDFSVPIAPQGTDFQRKVWTSLQRIPFGHSDSYGALAQKLGNADLMRAVGQANHVNPIAIIVPCHRVVGSDRSLVGYGGGLWRKRWLLEHERGIKEGTRATLLTEYV